MIRSIDPASSRFSNMFGVGLDTSVWVDCSSSTAGERSVNLQPLELMRIIVNLVTSICRLHVLRGSLVKKRLVIYIAEL